MGTFQKKFYKKATRTKKPFKKPKLPIRHQIADVAYKGYSTAMWIKNLINVEKKSIDNLSQYPVDWTGVQQVINVPTLGTADTSRIGDSILNKKIVYRGMVQRSIIGTPVDSILRIILIRDKANIIGNIDRLLQYHTSVFGVHSPKSDDDMYNSKILYDQKFILTQSDPIKTFDIQISDLNDHTHFEHSTTNIKTGAYKLFVLSNADPAALNHKPSITWVSRFYYIDN